MEYTLHVIRTSKSHPETGSMYAWHWFPSKSAAMEARREMIDILVEEENYRLHDGTLYGDDDIYDFHLIRGNCMVDRDRRTYHRAKSIMRELQRLADGDRY